MGITEVLGLLGGLALFLYGMTMMSNGLEAAAGNRMRGILEKLTSNRILGVLVGAGITAVIQSSSATTVMVVGFVNSGMMQLKQAIGVIMGANIGTTVTGQLIALDVGALAPLIAFVGVVFIVFTKRQILHHWGAIIAGLGVLFIGMDMMSAAMVPLRDSQTFVELVSTFRKPIVGILAGAIFTAMIQSSSAAVGILQALAISGVVGLENAVFVLFGMNIGTCITAVLASITANRAAKRTTIIHLMFNVTGTVIFTIICTRTPLVTFVESLTPSNTAAQIANMHTIFNIVTTLLLLPFAGQMAKIATRILPETEKEKEGGFYLKYIKGFDMASDGAIGTSAIAAAEITNEIWRMADMVQKNVDRCFAAVIDGNADYLDEAEETEEYIDFLNKEILKKISHTVSNDQNPEAVATSTSLFRMCGNLERIGDHAINIVGYTRRMNESKIDLSDIAKEEVKKMRDICNDAMTHLLNNGHSAEERLIFAASCEQRIDDMTEQFRDNQISRMQNGVCSGEACVLYSEMLSDFERIGDHILNIGHSLAHADVDE